MLTFTSGRLTLRQVTEITCNYNPSINIYVFLSRVYLMVLAFRKLIKCSKRFTTEHILSRLGPTLECILH